MNEAPWTQTVGSDFFSNETDPFASAFEGSDDMTVSSSYFLVLDDQDADGGDDSDAVYLGNNGEDA